MPSGLQPWLIVSGLLVGAYLCGAIPFGLLVGWLNGVEIRTRGSGNIGATNVGRVLGRGWGLLVFGLDVLKGLVPTALTGYVLWRPDFPCSGTRGESTAYVLWVLIAVASVVGHMFPVYLKFKGGKGVATSLGVVLGIYPHFAVPGLIALVLWGVVALLTRYVSVASMAAAVAFPIIFSAVAYRKREAWGSAGQLWPLYVCAIVVAALVVYRHRSNIRRLIAGSESRIGGSREG